MKAIHILSHNAVLVRDKEERKCIVTGKGIGFMKEVGDRIKPQLIQNVFIEDTYYMTRRTVHN